MVPPQFERVCISGSECILFEILDWSHRIYLLGSLAKLAWIGLIQLTCLGGGFFGLQSSISNKIYSELLMYTLSPCKGPIESFSISFKVCSVHCVRWPKKLRCKNKLLLIRLTVQIQKEKSLTLKLTGLWPFKLWFPRGCDRLNFCATPLFIKQKMFLFSRWTNGVITIFWYSFWFPTLKNPLGVSVPGSSLLWANSMQETSIFENPSMSVDAVCCWRF